MQEEIVIRANNNTLRSEIKRKYEIDFSKNNTIEGILGFTSQRKLKPNVCYESDIPVKIIKVNVFRVECNITAGAYDNGKLVHLIHEFFLNVPLEYKISETPKNVVYLSVTVRVIDRLSIIIVGQNNDIVDFRGEKITVRLHLGERKKNDYIQRKL